MSETAQVACFLFPCNNFRKDMHSLESLELQTTDISKSIYICDAESCLAKKRSDYGSISGSLKSFIFEIKSPFTIFVFSPDCFISPAKLSIQVRFLMCHPKVNLCYTRVLRLHSRTAECIDNPEDLQFISASSIVFRTIVAQNIMERFPGLLESGHGSQIIAQKEYGSVQLDLCDTESF